MRASTLAAVLVVELASYARAQPPQAPRHMAAPGPGTTVSHGTSKPAPPPPQAPPPVRVTPRDQTPPSPFAAGPFTYAPRYNQRQRPHHGYNGSGGYYGSGGYFGFYDVEPPRYDESRSPAEELSMDGVLFLEVEPRLVDVYVDGFFVGSAEDFALNGLTLRAGRHWLELKAPGFETLTVPADISVGRPVRYRGALSRTPLTPSRTENESSRAPQTLYVITGCYAGNRPPVAAALPAGCDMSRVRVLPEAR